MSHCLTYSILRQLRKKNVPLLDTYGGATVAYSLRKLNSDYTGYCIKVRRSSDDSLQDIGFNSQGVVNKTNLLSFVGNGDGFIHTWYDQSGNENDATQTTNDNQPKIVLSGLVAKDGVDPIIDFGTNSNRFFLLLPTGLLFNTDIISYFHIARIKDYTSSNGGLFGPYNNVYVGFEVIQAGVESNRSLLRINNTRRNRIPFASASELDQIWNNDELCLSSILGNSSSVGVYKNGSAITLVNSSALPSLDFDGQYAIGTYATNLGTGYNLNGKVTELVIYTTDQLANRIGIEQNINNFYSIY